MPEVTEEQKELYDKFIETIKKECEKYPAQPVGDFDRAMSLIKQARLLLDRAEAELLALNEQGE
jgi:hypothetical protein